MRAAAEDRAKQRDLREQIVDAVSGNESTRHIHPVVGEIQPAVELGADLRAVHDAVANIEPAAGADEIGLQLGEPRRRRIDLDRDLATALVAPRHTLADQPPDRRLVAQNEIAHRHLAVDAAVAEAGGQLQLAAFHAAIKVGEGEQRTGVGRRKIDLRRGAVARLRHDAAHRLAAQPPDELELAQRAVVAGKMQLDPGHRLLVVAGDQGRLEIEVEILCGDALGLAGHRAEFAPWPATAAHRSSCRGP